MKGIILVTVFGLVLLGISTCKSQIFVHEPPTFQGALDFLNNRKELPSEDEVLRVSNFMKGLVQNVSLVQVIPALLDEMAKPSNATVSPKCQNDTATVLSALLEREIWAIASESYFLW